MDASSAVRAVVPGSFVCSEQGRGCPGQGLMLLGNLFLSPPTAIFPPSAADAGTTNDSNITEAVAPSLYLWLLL